MRLNINTDAVVKFTNTLEKMHKSALPAAVRGALNKAVFDVKTKTMPAKAKSTFEQRSPNFFKANSRFENATGFNVNQMKATVGFVGKSYAVKELEEQERGGTIGHRSYIPMKSSRVSQNNAKAVRAANRLSRIKNVINSRKQAGKTPGQKFIKAVFKAGVGGHVLGDYKGRQILWRVNSLKRLKGGQFKLTPLYSFSHGRKVNINSTRFMEKSSIESAKKIERFFIDEAKRQIAKFK